MNLDPNFVIVDSVDLPSSYLFKNIKIPHFSLISLSDLIEFQGIKKTLILCEFDPYSPLYYLIHDFNIKLVSLVIVLTCVCVYSTTTRIHFVTSHTFRSPWHSSLPSKNLLYVNRASRYITFLCKFHNYVKHIEFNFYMV